MATILGPDFFNRKTETVAKELLGKFLVRTIGGKASSAKGYGGPREIAAMIMETEAYLGPHDLASHASKGRTQRTEVMFGHPGHFYVYLIYGIYEMLNIVTREHGYPAGVLIRGVIIENGTHLNGPGKVTRYLHIDRTLNAKPAVKETGLWVEDRGIITGRIKKLPRVGVAYAGPLWSVKKLRFLLDKY